MSVKKVEGGYRWGSTGKVFKTYDEAAARGTAIRKAQLLLTGRLPKLRG